MGKKVLEKKQIVSECPMFGIGWDETLSECSVVCKEEYRDEWEVCKELTKNNKKVEKAEGAVEKKKEKKEQEKKDKKVEKAEGAVEKKKEKKEQEKKEGDGVPKVHLYIDKKVKQGAGVKNLEKCLSLLFPRRCFVMLDILSDKNLSYEKFKKIGWGEGLILQKLGFVVVDSENKKVKVFFDLK